VSSDGDARDAFLESAQDASNVRRRAMLREKGRALFHRACDGVGSCAESFALHHLRVGDLDVVRDFLDYLRLELDGMPSDDPRRAPTEALVQRIQARLPAV
jgi:hypothetical protein